MIEHRLDLEDGNAIVIRKRGLDGRHVLELQIPVVNEETGDVSHYEETRALLEPHELAALLELLEILERA